MICSKRFQSYGLPNFLSEWPLVVRYKRKEELNTSNVNPAATYYLCSYYMDEEVYLRSVLNPLSRSDNPVSSREDRRRRRRFLSQNRWK